MTEWKDGKHDKDRRTSLFAINSQSTRPNSDMKLVEFKKGTEDDTPNPAKGWGKERTNESLSETKYGFIFVFFRLSTRVLALDGYAAEQRPGSLGRRQTQNKARSICAP